MALYQPLNYILIYLIFTLIVFNFGPIEWDAQHSPVNIFLMITWTFFVIGYYLAARLKISNAMRLNHFLNYKKIIKLGMYSNLITMPFAIYAYTGKLPNQISFDLALQGEAYSEFYKHVTQDKSSFRTILSFFRAFLAPLIYGSIILGYKYWFQLPKKYKIYVILSIVAQVFFSFARGSDKEIVDLIIFFVVANIAMGRKNFFKKIKRVLIFCLILIMFFSIFSERRLGRYSFELPNCFSQANVCVDPENSRVASVIGRNNYISMSMFASYLTQGYNGLSLAMSLDYQSTFGLGHSPIAIRLYERISGDNDLYKKSYNYRLREKGWSDLYAWSTLYTWIANDVSFYLVPLALLLLGMILGLSWRQSLKYKDDSAFMVFSLLFLGLIYSPANNQLGVSLEIFATWIFWLFYWLSKNLLPRKKGYNYE